MLNLSLRLKTIASLVPRGARVCDVGTDHAFLPIYLAENNITQNVIATDLNEKPLKNARENLKKSGVSGVELRLCDGLSAVEESEVDTVIIAGMGGEVIIGIMDACEWLQKETISIILQPTTSAEILRRFLCENRFEILEEIPVLENSKLYSVMKVKYSGISISYPEHYYFIGKIPCTKEGILYIKKQQKRIIQCIEAFKMLDNKQQEYRLYEQINSAINDYLTENSNVT